MDKNIRLKPISIMLSLGLASLLLAGCSTSENSPNDQSGNKDLAGATTAVTNYIKAINSGDAEKALTFVTKESYNENSDILLTDKYLEKDQALKILLADPQSEAEGQATIEGTFEGENFPFDLQQQENGKWLITDGAFLNISVPASSYIPSVSVNNEDLKADPTLYAETSLVNLNGFLSHYTVAPSKDATYFTFPEAKLPNLTNSILYQVSVTLDGEAEIAKQFSDFINSCYTDGLTGDERAIKGCPNVKIFGPDINIDTDVTWEKTSENPIFMTEYANGKVDLTSSDILTQSYTFGGSTYEWPVNMIGTGSYGNEIVTFNFTSDPLQ